MKETFPPLGGDWSMIEAQLPADWRKLAYEYHQVGHARPHLGAKLTDAGILLRLVLFHVATDMSLKITVGLAAAAKLIVISAVALHKRMRSVGPYLAVLLSRMLKLPDQFSPQRWAGYEVNAVDATTVVRPGAKGTTARVHYALELERLALIQCTVTDETGGETFRRFVAKPNQLWIGDRCYCNPPGIASIRVQQADVLVRYNFGSLPLYDIWGRSLNVDQKLSKLKRPLQIREWVAFVHHEPGKRITGRLVALRLPADKAEEARARLRKEEGPKVTEQALARAEFVVVFTTVPKDRLSAEQVIELYRLRWQIELRIKRDKSICNLDLLPNFRPDTIYSWLMAKLLAETIAQRIATPQVAFPPCGQ